MKRVALLLTLLCVLSLLAPMRLVAEDMIRIRVIDENRVASEETLTGKIESVSTTEVSLTQAGTQQGVPCNTILWLQYENEPIDLTTARTMFLAARYDEALENLSKSEKDRASLTEPVLAELDYLKAACIAQSALALGERDPLTAAGKELVAFQKKYAASWHLFDVYETTGRILLALGRNDQAKGFFDRLADAPWSDVKLRGMTASAEILLATQKWEEAAQAFQAVIDFAQENSPLVNEAKDFARIGLAQALAGQEKFDDALSLLRRIIDENPLRNVSLAARLYNTIGAVSQAAGRNQDALLAYLHVDLLYSSCGQEHSRALRELYRLWTAKGRQDRAEEALHTLQNKYKINL